MANYNNSRNTSKNTSIITDVRVNTFESNSNVKAYASVTLCECFAINGIKIVEGKNGLFVSMPQRLTGKGRNGGYKDICFPITKEFRDELCTAILDEYNAVTSE